MKLVDVAEFYSEQGGGVLTYIRQKLLEGKRLGVRTVIIAPGAEDRREARDGGEVVWVKSLRIPFDKRYFLFTGSKAIHQLLDEEKADVVEGSSPWMGGHAVASWQGPAVKSFFIHQDPVSSYPQRVLEPVLSPGQVDRLFTPFWRYMRGLSERCDTTVVSGDWLRDRLAGLGLARVAAVPFGIDQSLFSPAHRDAALKREILAICGIDDPEAPLFATICRHHGEKRHETVIEAFKRVRQTRPAGLYIVGDGPSRARVEKLARGVPGVHVAGAIRDRAHLARVMASADALFHGCGSETYGMVIAEALCSGLPIIVPDSGGAFDLAGPGHAEVYALGDAASAAAAVERFLTRDHDAMRDAAQEAATRIRQPADHFEHLFRHYADIKAQKDRQPEAPPAMATVPQHTPA